MFFYVIYLISSCARKKEKKKNNREKHLFLTIPVLFELPSRQRRRQLTHSEAGIASPRQMWLYQNPHHKQYSSHVSSVRFAA